jgi:hypothetical protein
LRVQSRLKIVHRHQERAAKCNHHHFFFSDEATRENKNKVSMQHDDDGRTFYECLELPQHKIKLYAMVEAECSRKN